MSTLQDRLADLFPEPRERGLIAEISELCEVKPASVSNWFNNPRKVSTISRNCAERICAKYGLQVNPAWLAEGQSPKTPVLGANIPVAMPAPPEQSVLNGYVRLEHMPPQPAMGSGSVADELVPAFQHIDVLEQWVRQNVGSVHPERIKVLTARGHSMRPTIHDQDLVFVDVWQKDIREPGIYVLDVNGRFLLKKALIQSTGTLILRSDNVQDYPDEERHDLKKAAETIHVSGRVLAWWTLRRG
jgi:hypothetical protein